MTDGIYPTLGRQSGLLREMEVIAANIANASTTGYRAAGITFSEFVVDTGQRHPSLSLANANVETTRLTQGPLSPTGGTLDLAIEGEGFFVVARDGVPHLTRAGAFLTGPEGNIVTPSGEALLDLGGAPVAVPPGARNIAVGEDGTLSADGAPVAQIAVALPPDGAALERAAGTMFNAEDGWVPVETPNIVQGFLERSNVDPMIEVARMVAVQNAYELGQSFVEREDQRVRSIFRLMEQ